MSKKRTLSERLLAVSLCMILLIGLMPVGVLRARAADDVFGTTVVTTPSGNQTVDEYGNITIDVTGVDIVYDPANGWVATASVTAADSVNLRDAKLGNDRFSKDNSYTQTYTQTLTPGADGTAEVSLSGTFDWDGRQETANQTITMSGKVNLVKAEQTLSIIGPETIAYGEEATYTVEGIQSGESPVFRITAVGDPFEIVSSNENSVVIKANEVGACKLEVSVQGNTYYDDADASVEINSVPANQEISIVGPETIAYGATATYSVEGIQSQENAVFTCTEVDGKAEFTDNGDGTATLVATEPGTVVLTASVQGNDHYNEASEELTVTIALVPQDSFGFLMEEDSFVYDGKNKVYAITGIENESVPVLTVSDAKDAEGKDIDASAIAEAQLLAEENAETGEISYSVQVNALQAGSFTVNVSVEGDEWYDGAEDSLTISVAKADQSELTISGVGSEITYNQYKDNKVTLSVTGGSADGEVTYKSSNETVASIAGDVLTIHQAGSVTITATMAGNECYNPVEAEPVELTISKAQQDITLVSEDSVDNNTESYPIPLVYTEGTYAKDKFVFEEASKDSTMSGTTVGGDGVITIGEGDYGTVTVRVSNTGDDCYESWPSNDDGYVTFTLTVEQIVVESGDYPFSGTVGENGWYTSAGYISREGYQLADHVESNQGNKNKHSFNSKYNLTTEGVHNVVLCVKADDQRGISHSQNIGTYKLDLTNPVSCDEPEYNRSAGDIALEILTLGFYNSELTVTISASDATSGLAKIYYSYEKDENQNPVWLSETFDGVKEGSVEFKIPENYNGKIQYYAVDVAGRVEGTSESEQIVVDSVVPTRTVTWSEAKQIVKSDTLETVEAFDYASEELGFNLYYDGDAVATIAITEANFYAEDVVIKDNGNVISVDKSRNGESGWTQNGDVWTAEVTLTNEGEHVLTVEYTDRSKNEMASYTSNTIIVDKTSPVISVDPSSDGDRTYYGAGQSITVTIKEQNFRASDVTFTVTAKDITDTEVTAVVAYGTWTSDKDVHTIDLTFAQDANYTLDVEYTDLALRSSNDLPKQQFTVDATAPQNLQIAYSKSLLDVIIENVTFGYYNARVTVTLTATDDTAGIESFSYEYNLDEGVSTVNKGGSGVVTAEQNGNVYSAFFSIPAEALTKENQFNGYISFTAKDRSGMSSSCTDSGKHMIIVDDICPERVVTWSEAKQVVSNETLKNVENFNYASENQNVRLYYTGEAVATIKITEANFYEEDVVVKDNGTALSVAWSHNGDERTAVVTLTEEGDHVLTVDYIDRSTNQMTSYTSDTIIIDNTAPVVSVDPSNAGTRNYYGANQTVTVTIQEHNFRADDVQILVAAKDVQEDDVTVIDYAAHGADRSNWSAYDEGVWTREGDTYTMTLEFAVDANYTLDVVYTDLALHEANDLAEQLFTVDKAAPDSMSITYETSLFSAVLNKITFGYYGAQTTVTISAVDNTAGIDSFSYAYTLNDGVSTVNKGGSGTVAASQNGNQFTASFTVPAEALNASNQFNGYISFSATDRAQNTSDLTHQGEQAIVVDNIAPRATITYNEPVQQVNNVSYYADNINATITINEANFFSEDVVVTVTRNGANYPVNVTWTNNTVDTHTGTFTLTDDGDYIVSVTYTDRSKNQMADYTSNQLTLDTEIPTITVSNIVNDSANTAETYSFTITASDVNFDINSFEPKLTAVVREEDGSCVTKTIDLGNRVTVEEGTTYAYEIKNLEEDAIYTLTCSVTDLAGNSNSMMLLDDNKEYETVQFSINREGSAFALGDYTADLVNNYYTQYVTEDLVIVEVNADILEEHHVTLNGKELTEGADFTVTAEGGNGSWMKYTYSINKALFEEEGEYTLVVSSKDKAGNNAFSDVKDATVSFVVDRTAPVITVTGMADNGRYQTESQTVTLIPTDDGGALSSILVCLVDDDGNVIEELLNLSGDALTEALENGEGMLTFEIGEGLYQNVQIICKDSAQSSEGPNVYDVTFTNLSVSANGFMIFWANRPLRYGVIFLLLLLVLIVIYLLTRKKKKKEN